MKSPNRCSALACGVLALAGLAATPAAQAIVIYSGIVNLTVPDTDSGLYLNVIDGSTYTGPATFPALGGPGANYDINIFGNSSWSFFSPGASGQSVRSVPAVSRGYVSDSLNGAATNLPLDTLIDGNSLFNTGSPSGMAVSTGETVLIGFRFRNENSLATAADDTVHYGWARLVLSPGVPGTLIDYAYETDALTGIPAGAVGPVPEPAGWLMMGLGVAGLALRRRQAAT